MSKGQLVFANGVVMKGELLGVTDLEPDSSVSGTVVPYTSMTDYQALLCDPATSGQLLCMTYPLIGNVGRIKSQSCLPEKVQAAGLILRESISEVDHWQSLESLRDWLMKEQKLAICGVDTRDIIRMLRKQGPMAAVIGPDDPSQTEALLNQAKAYTCQDMTQVYAGLPEKQVFAPQAILAEERSESGISKTSEILTAQDSKQSASLNNQNETRADSVRAVRKISVLNLGMQSGQIQALTSRGCQVTVVPLPDAPDKITQTKANALLDELLLNQPDAVLLSSGPEKAAEKASAALLDMVSKLYTQTTLWAVDSGHLLLAKACGLQLKKLPMGHHGANCPVYEQASGRTYMTGQHHQLTVNPDVLPEKKNISLSYRNINDQSVEGLIYDQRHFSTQFLPDIESHAHQTGHIWDQLVARLG